MAVKYQLNDTARLKFNKTQLKGSVLDFKLKGARNRNMLDSLTYPGIDMFASRKSATNIINKNVNSKHFIGSNISL